MRTVRYGSDYAASLPTMQEGFYAETNFIGYFPCPLQAGENNTAFSTPQRPVYA
ncbi:hypothetical protein KHQ08_11635 [Pseudochrobactrum algeriensis]|uniref:hypothetical protein n=1 Tax=Pseudochrobactrum TaxID=354349 RepID=UPI001BCE2EAE|nr:MULTISPECIES: hypothetical protein [Pseudochrobactrum]QVQ35855.1 hypothetical protein KHQ08_11635 [Pseudochrobactrum algeriensis]QVQ42991.1 hypothetical protein KHQ09_11890 [Pseudochrobactrum algeriensis]QYM73734.1 hypothetical protein K1X45_04775 [Pseudochrobactrum sp. Wa41.01b-1]